MNLDAQLEAATRSEGSFFGGADRVTCHDLRWLQLSTAAVPGSGPSHADFNVYHHLANARRQDVAPSQGSGSRNPMSMIN